MDKGKSYEEPLYLRSNISTRKAEPYPNGYHRLSLYAGSFDRRFKISQGSV